MGSYNVLKVKESPGHMKLQNGKVKFTLIFIFTKFFYEIIFCIFRNNNIPFVLQNLQVDKDLRRGISDKKVTAIQKTPTSSEKTIPTLRLRKPRVKHSRITLKFIEFVNEMNSSEYTNFLNNIQKNLDFELENEELKKPKTAEPMEEILDLLQNTKIEASLENKMQS